MSTSMSSSRIASTSKCTASKASRVFKLQITCSSGRSTSPTPAATQSSQPGNASRRQSLLGAASLALPLVLQAGEARAVDLKDLTRLYMRPEVDPMQGLIALLDARSTLKEVAELAATPADSEQRFNSRVLLPGMAKRLREAGPAAPVVAGQYIAGGDKEATLSVEYGGTAAGSDAVTDAVYIGLGRVLTISGRTIRPEALASPAPAQDAYAALDAFLGRVDPAAMEQAQAARKARAG